MTGLAESQLKAVNALVAKLVPSNAFYAEKLSSLVAGDRFQSLADFATRVPFTTKEELVADHRKHSPYGSHLTYPLEKYTRLHQTSGTSGQPMAWLDSEESWQWVLDNWKVVWQSAGAQPGESVLFPFSFGPFLGFWAAFESGAQLGMRCIPAGGQTSAQRLSMVMTYGPKWLCCTPTYALHLAAVAREQGIDLGQSGVEHLLIAGEPGGSIPEVRQRIEAGWPGAQVHDHHGMTEVGPVTYATPDDAAHLRIIHQSFFAEVIDPKTGDAVAEGELGELVLTTLGRTANPLLRYRTGDIVKPVYLKGEPPGAFALAGGILSRADDMIVVRGVNLYPSGIDAVVRSCPEIGEYAVLVERTHSLAEVMVRIESTSDAEIEKVLEQKLREAFGLRIPVTRVACGELPVFEMKAKRWKVVEHD